MRDENVADLALLMDALEATQECLILHAVAATGLETTLNRDPSCPADSYRPARRASEHARRAAAIVGAAVATLETLLAAEGTQESTGPLPGDPGATERHRHANGFACPVVACGHLG